MKLQERTRTYSNPPNRLICPFRPSSSSQKQYWVQKNSPSPTKGSTRPVREERVFSRRRPSSAISTMYSQVLLVHAAARYVPHCPTYSFYCQNQTTWKTFRLTVTVSRIRPSSCSESSFRRSASSSLRTRSMLSRLYVC